MTQHKNLFCFALLLLFSAALLLTCAGGEALAQQSQDPDLYWSETNKPVFYGATEITFSLGAVDVFDAKDSRFRLFAKDFEDGDLDSRIVRSGTVNAAKAGDYTLQYSVRDSHGNVSQLTVPVHVVDDGKNAITVRRTLYALPNDWNMQLAGFSRCNSGDRQILGIYLPHGASFRMKALCSNLKDTSGNSGIGVALLNDDARRESSTTISTQPAQTDADGYVTVQNTITSGLVNGEIIPDNTACVPLVSTPKLLRGKDISTTYRIEISYDADTVHPLQYYHYGDFGGGDEGESKFVAQWKASGDGHAVEENNAITVIVPIGDMERWQTERAKNNGNRFTRNLDDHLAYYEKVVTFMDKIVGLDYNPDDAIDQNLRAKYLVKANAHGAGAAYYSGNHVGVNSRIEQTVTYNDAEYKQVVRGQMYSFFEMNWGGLHELGHGYQGGLGNGSMGLGETSNNILCHYVQMDDEIWTAQSAYWLGKTLNAPVKDSQGQDSTVEQIHNVGRLTNQTYDDFFVHSEVGDRLYFLINLFDSFEGWQTYAKFFSWYRSLRRTCQQLSLAAPNQQDCYVRFFAETYNTNVLPYFNAWGLDTSDAVTELAYKCGTTLSVLQDAAGDKTDDIKQSENLSLSYGLVSDEVLAANGVEGSLTVRFNINSADRLQGKTVLLEKGGVVRYNAHIDSGEARFDGISAGSYLVRVPVLTDYICRVGTANVKQGQNELAADYTARPDSDFNPQTLRISGPNNTVGLTIAFSDNLTATLSKGGANLGNQGNEWKQNPDEVFVSVKLADSSGKQLFFQEVKGSGFFATVAEPSQQLSVDYGSKVTVYTHAPQYVQVISQLTDKQLDCYRITTPTDGKTYVYTLTKQGLVADYLAETDLQQAIYDETKQDMAAQLQRLVDGLQDGALDAAYYQTEDKAAILDLYNRLQPQDRQQFDETCRKIVQGGSPVIAASDIGIDVAHTLDWTQYVSATDAEDGPMTLDSHNLQVQTAFNGTQAGTFDVTFFVTDSDGNVSSQQVTLTVAHDAVVTDGDNDPAHQVSPADGSSGLSTTATILIWVGAFAAMAVAAVVIVLILKKRR